LHTIVILDFSFFEKFDEMKEQRDNTGYYRPSAIPYFFSFFGIAFFMRRSPGGRQA